MANTQRLQRIGDQIQRELADIIRLELKDPRVGLVTVTGVDVTPDLAHAKV
ncbi:MAG: ribosome-binding factor A, partial [Burkholderiales bacterium]